MVNDVCRYCLVIVSLWISLQAHAAGAKPDDRVSAKHDGQDLFQQHCAKCHDQGYTKAPTTNNLKLMTAQSIYKIQTEGAMQPFAAHLKNSEKQSIAEYLSGHTLDDSLNVSPTKQCTKKSKRWFDYDHASGVNSWGIDGENRRFIPGNVARMPLDAVKNLRLKWAFGFSGASRARSQPAVAGGGLFIGSHTGEVYALDAKTGCQHWVFQASGEVRTAIVVSPWTDTQPSTMDKAPSVYFGDLFGNVYAVNAENGVLRWKIKADDHPAATITGSPVLYNDQLLVPVSAMGNFNKRCCTNRGAVLSLDPQTGAVRWKTYTIPTPPVEQYRTAEGFPQYGPAGASVMTTPTIDKKRGLIYIGTGQNHGAETDKNSDAIFALAINDGHIVWQTQTIQRDVWPVSPSRPKNKKEVHLDFDFSASPILIHGKHREDILVAGQKSGEIFGLSPKDGSIVWRNKLGRGGAMGGVHFGMAADKQALFIPIHDNDTWLKSLSPQPMGMAKPGLYALDPFTGKTLWSAPLPSLCHKSQSCLGYSAAITAIPKVVFAARRDGEFQAFNSADGEIIWSFDTAQKFITLNGDTANGGSIAGAGPVIADGMVYINSGYGIYGSLPGNVLLAFSAEKVMRPLKRMKKLK